jgi:hypothetical protein
MDGTALVVCDGFFATATERPPTVVRGTELPGLGVVDAPTA